MLKFLQNVMSTITTFVGSCLRGKGWHLLQQGPTTYREGVVKKFTTKGHTGCPLRRSKMGTFLKKAIVHGMSTMSMVLLTGD